MTWFADKLGAEAGELLAPRGRHHSHGVDCQALLRGLGLPPLTARVPAGCQPALASGLRGPGDLAKALNGSVCLLLRDRSVSRAWAGEPPRPSEDLLARFAAAQDSPHALPPSRIAAPGRTVVALHVRRGDVELSGPTAPRATSNEWYVRVMRAAAAKGPTFFGKPGPADFHVYSEGEPEDFADLVAAGATLHLGAGSVRVNGPQTRWATSEALQAMADLVSADVLVMARSSFSFLPAVYSRGVVLYQKFWVRPLPGWRDADAFLREAEASGRASDAPTANVSIHMSGHRVDGGAPGESRYF